MSDEADYPEAATPRLPFPLSIIGIAGASGSGKTTLAAELARELDGIHFPLDKLLSSTSRTYRLRNGPKRTSTIQP